MAVVSKQYNIYKPMRPSQIPFGKKQVTEVIRSLEEELRNPFGVGYNGLHNLSSREEVADDLASSILELFEKGKKMKEELITSRITCNQEKFHDPLKRFNVKTFKTLIKYVVKCKHVQATVEVNRNTLGSLLSFSMSKERERAIDLPATLAYPLSLIPLSLAIDDGKRRETLKSKLIALLVENVALKDPKTDNSVKEVKGDATFVIDLIATIQAMANLGKHL